MKTKPHSEELEGGPSSRIGSGSIETAGRRARGRIAGRTGGKALFDVGMILLVFGTLYFSLLGSRPLANPDEGRYTEIPREMLESGDFVTPRLNGVKYFEKPVLVYWLTALGIRAFGLNEFGARFGCAAFAVFGIAGTYLFGRKVYGRGVAVWSSIVLGTSTLYMGLSQIVLLDMVLTTLMSGALFSFLVATNSRAGCSKGWFFLLFYFLMGLAVLAKGLVGLVLPIAVVGIWIAVGNRWSEIRSYRLVPGTIALLVVAVPWHFWVAKLNPDFLRFYFVHEHFVRYTSQSHARVEPWWFFVPVVAAGVFPWCVFLPQALRLCFSRGLRVAFQDRTSSFLLIWIGFITLFFSVSQSKLIPYILPVFPALSLIIGRFLAGSSLGGMKKRIHLSIWVYVGLCWALAIGFTLAVLPEKYSDHISAVNGWRIALFATLAAASTGAIAFIRLWKTRSALLSMAFGSIGLFVGLISLYSVLESKSTKSVAEYLRVNSSPSEDVYCLGEYFQDLPVYLEKTVLVVDYEGELAFGIHAEPALSSDRFLSRTEFARRWRSSSIQYAVVKSEDLLGWASEIGPHTRVLKSTRRYSLIINENGIK